MKKPARPSSPAWASCIWKFCARSSTRDNKVDVIVGKPKVAYKETITKKVRNVRGKHVKQSGGRGQFGDCTISLEPFDGRAGVEPEVLKKGLGRRLRLRKQGLRRLDSQGIHSVDRIRRTAWPPRPACWRTTR